MQARTGSVADPAVEPRAAPASGARPDAVTALQRLVGNQAVTRLLIGTAAGSPVQRALQQQPAPTGTSKKRRAPRPVGTADLPKSVDTWSVALRLVVTYWASTDASVVTVTYSTLDDLKRQATAALPAMTQAFVDWLTDTQLGDFVGSLTRMAVTPSTALDTAIQHRTQSIRLAKAAAFGTSVTLPDPQHDSRYSTPRGFATQPAATTGRDDGAWHSVSNTLPGAGGQTTGSVNLALMEDALTHRVMRRNDDGSYSQICPSCMRVVEATGFEVDHQQAFSDLRANLNLLAEAMQVDAALYTTVAKATPKFSTWFMTQGKPGQPGCTVAATGAAVHEFSNDLQNLVRICRKCNGALGKSDTSITDWLRASPYYGKNFLAANPLSPSFTVINRTAAGKGWGATLREWFVKFHLPVLEQQFVVERIGRLTHRLIAEQDRAAYDAHFETDPAAKEALEARADYLGGSNRAFLGGLGADEQYFDGTLTGASPTAFAPGSPARWENERREMAQGREKRKRTEETESTTPFQRGRELGLTNAPQTAWPVFTGPDSAVFQQGFDAGKVEYERKYREGVTAACKVTDRASLAVPAPTGVDSAWAAGFTAAALARKRAYEAGRAQRAAGAELDYTSLPADVPDDLRIRLLQDLIDGWSAGRASAAGPTTSTPRA